MRKQIDGVAMGSPLGPALANIFVGFYESKPGVSNYFTRRARFGKTVEAAGRTLIGKQGEDLFSFGDHGPRTNVISKMRGFHLVFYSNFAPLRLIF